MNYLQCGVSGQNILSGTAGASQGVLTTSNSASGVVGGVYYDSTLWNYWQNCYYPQVIRESYPVYIQDRAMDKGKQAFEIVKALMDKDLLSVEKVKDFVDAMDTILKTL